MSFLITVFIAITPVAVFLYQEFVKPKPVAIAPHNAGNATTSGPNSPAISGDGNSITYDQPHSAKKDKKAKE